MISIDKNTTTALSKEAVNSARKRKNLNYHTDLSDTLQRMLNAIEPYSYVHPHKHEDPDKREAFLVLTGKGLVMEFDETGNIVQWTLVGPETGVFGVEIAARVYHAIWALEPGTVIYEVKDGPYLVANDKNFATWAPKEGSPGCIEYMNAIFEKLNLKPTTQA